MPSASSTSLSSSRTLCVYGLKLFKATPKELIDEIWQIIQRQYIDGTFNQVDWLAVRKEYLSKSYSSTQEACQSAQEMLKKLGDPNTKLINREKFQQFPISGDLVDIGIYERIEINPVEYSQQQSLSGKVGYIYLKQFSQNAAREMQSAIRDLEKQQVSGYILDLRGNSGGLLSSSVEIAQMWLDRGTIVSTFDRTGEQLREVARGRALTNKPLVILVNQGSAGASEILAAALQDNRRAVLVGNRTFGKNTMQSIRPLEDGSFLALTIVRYDTPNGRNINKSGIIPDVNVELSPSDRQKIATLSDPQYSMALSILQKQIAAKTN
ncbi:MAG: S41 family peptidase [Trichormus sp.]